MKSINTLVADIYATVKARDGWFTNELAKAFSDSIAITLQAQLGEERKEGSLRLSKMGPTCPCALWHSVHRPELSEPFQPWTIIKFSYGHILEALALTLAKAAGHSVVGEQDVLTVDGIVGHRDAVVDGCIVDVKSCGSYGFEKFKTGSIKEDDLFGYLDQLDGYAVGSLRDPLVTVHDRAYILAVHQQLGHLCLYEHIIREQSIRERIERYKKVVERDHPPECECGTEPFGASGNLRLDTRASYSSYKFACKPNLRTFVYKKGPIYLTKVVRRPDVLEIDKNGKIVYNYL